MGRHEPAERLVVGEQREPGAMEEVAINLDTPHCCQALSFVAGVVALVFVEAAAAAGDHILLPRCVSLAEHCA